MVARELQPDSSGSGNFNSECSGLFQLGEDLEVLDHVMATLKIDSNHPRRMPAGFEDVLAGMPIEELTGLLERVVLYFLASRSRPK